MKIVAILCIVLICYIIFENFYIFKSRVDISKNNLPDYLANKKIAFISDLHIKGNKGQLWRLLNKIKSENVDMIFISGDFVSRHIKDMAIAEWMLAELSSIAPTYLSIGNHELDLSDSFMESLKNSAKRYGAQLLDDASIRLGENVYIYGASCARNCYKNQNGGYRNLADYTLSDMKKALGEKIGFSIVLAHNPLYFDAYSQWGADIVLSGHIHGGAIRIPFVCGILSPERKLFPKFSSGIYKKANTTMFVTRGIAKLRIFSPKHIVFLQFSKKSDKAGCFRKQYLLKNIKGDL